MGHAGADGDGLAVIGAYTLPGEEVHHLIAALMDMRADGAAGDAALDGQALFLLLEGLDPLIVVAAGAEAARALGAAYRQEVPLDGACRLFGRDAVAFKSFEHMLDDAQSKQAAWALLKKLPRFGER